MMNEMQDLDGAAAKLAVSALTDEQWQKLSAAKLALHSIYGQVVLAMSSTARYRDQSLSDLGHLVLNPLIRDRIAVGNVKPAGELGSALTPPAIALWASVNEHVHKKVTEQVASHVFPIRLKAEDWDSGDIVWLLDVIAPTRDLATKVIAGFRQIAKTDNVHVHPVVGQLVDQEVLDALRTGSQQRKSNPDV